MGEHVDADDDGHSLPRRIAAVLRANRRRMVLNWAGLVGALPAFRARPGLALSAVLGEVPSLLDEVVNAIERGPELEGAVRDLDAAGEHAVGHARKRVALGLRASDLVQEFRHLRQVLWTEIRHGLQTIRATVTDVLDLERHVNAALDAVLALSVGAFENEAPVG